ncbi:alpha-1,3-mannosyltransferase CMT1 [Dactylonectria macrodidyma]|uniref:Alpha-1,3-mannosyltransferase CMT1 n=1 Tax=Dactylonectria macrodidyma TaxID=307937 RepID=A0A9P9JDW5_9HYPO|nr:alpha-1,3-mannosyltransferase CMT1 [Dactylonectria macrodidyma]
MRRKLWLLAAPVALSLFLALSLYFGGDQFRRIPLPSFAGDRSISTTNLAQDANITRPDVGNITQAQDAGGIANSSQPLEGHVVKDGIILKAAIITSYVNAIMDSESHKLSRLECPELNSTRYSNLKASDEGSSVEYFFALDLRQCLALLPTLLGSILEAIRFLGPERCALSIVEGHSPDGTYDILAAIKRNVEELGAGYYFHPSRIDTSKGDRIQKLAELRNMALKPLLDQPDRVTNTTTVLFLNDVAICTEDILELLYQRYSIGATMTCAMDWTYAGRDPTFYDVWVARGINGDSFFEIPSDGNWDSAWNLFWNAAETHSRFSRALPFQAFSCWNGAVTFAASLLTKEGLRFRRANREKDECEQGEPQLFCKDMWFRGLGKIAVIPTVNLEYSVEKGKMIKEAKGFVSDHVTKQRQSDERFEWAVQPPARVKCMPTWDHQFWKAWNQSLARRRK